MIHSSEPRVPETEEARHSRACLERTRTAVLNVLIAVGSVIAVSGGVLRIRAASQQPPATSGLRRGLSATLIVIAVFSYVTRRMMASHLGYDQAATSQSRFYWSHVAPAIIAALAAPLGLVYGWWVDSSVQSVIPFWVVALALGSLALPRASEVEYLHGPAPGSGGDSA
jgi:hypothetical protein